MSRIRRSAKALSVAKSAKQRLQEMLSETVIKKNPSLTSHYYHPDFALMTNGQRQDYQAFTRGHEKVYAYCGATVAMFLSGMAALRRLSSSTVAHRMILQPGSHAPQD